MVGSKATEGLCVLICWTGRQGEGAPGPVGLFAGDHASCAPLIWVKSKETQAGIDATAKLWQCGVWQKVGPGWLETAGLGLGG
jgi:hypothetical protein